MAEVHQGRILDSHEVGFLEGFMVSFETAMNQDAIDTPHLAPAFSGRSAVESPLSQPAKRSATLLAAAIRERPDLTDELLQEIVKVLPGYRFNATTVVHVVRALGKSLAEARLSARRDIKPASSGLIPGESLAVARQDLIFLNDIAKSFEREMAQDAIDTALLAPAFSGNKLEAAEVPLSQPAGKAATVLATAIQMRPDLTDELIQAIVKVLPGHKFNPTTVVHVVRALGNLLAETRTPTESNFQPGEEDKTALITAVAEGTSDDVTSLVSLPTLLS